MSEDDFLYTESSEALHPMNWAAYTLDCIPASDITHQEAKVWAKEIKKTHIMIGSIATKEPQSIGHMLSLAEAQSKHQVRTGKLVPGPLVLEGEVILSGIGLWIENEKSD